MVQPSQVRVFSRLYQIVMKGERAPLCSLLEATLLRRRSSAATRRRTALPSSSSTLKVILSVECLHRTKATGPSYVLLARLVSCWLVLFTPCCSGQSLQGSAQLQLPDGDPLGPQHDGRHSVCPRRVSGFVQQGFRLSIAWDDDWLAAIFTRLTAAQPEEDMGQDLSQAACGFGDPGGDCAWKYIHLCIYV